MEWRGPRQPRRRNEKKRDHGQEPIGAPIVAQLDCLQREGGGGSLAYDLQCSTSSGKGSARRKSKNSVSGFDSTTSWSWSCSRRTPSCP